MRYNDKSRTTSAMLDNEIEEALLSRLADEDEELAAEVRKRLSNS